jgi:DHA2 family multidrug resistance protein-like MFS transporter
VHDSVAGGVAVAARLRDDALAAVVRAAFVHGMDLTLTVSGTLVATGAVLAVLFLPRRARRAAATPTTALPAKATADEQR